jgi:sugar phosphate permease
MLIMKPGFLPKARKQSATPGARSAFDLWRIRGLRYTFIASAIISSAWDLFQLYFPVYGHSINLSASAIGAILGVFAVATFTIRVFLAPLSSRYTEAQIMTAGIFVSAVAFVLFPVFANPYILGLIAFLLGLGVGCGQPMSMSLIYVLAPPGARRRVCRFARYREQPDAPLDPGVLRKSRNRLRLLARVRHEQCSARGRWRAHAQGAAHERHS